MAQEHLAEITIEHELGGETVESHVGHIVRATPKTGGATYVRAHRTDIDKSYLWKGDPLSYDPEGDGADTEDNTKWEEEL